MENTILAFGSCGDNIRWEYDQARRKLTVTGSGAMTDYDYEAKTPPWAEFLRELRSLAVEEGITRIGSCAFAAALALTDVTLPKSLLSVGESAFFGCRKLQMLRLPGLLREIQRDAFADCRDLMTLHLPASVRKIEEGAFGGSVRRGFTVAEENFHFAAEEGVLYARGGRTLLAHPLEGDFRCRSGVERIASYACSDCTFAEARLSEGVREIGEEAFSPIWLRRLHLPESMTADCPLPEGVEILRAAGAERKVFISYSSRDASATAQLRRVLESHGISCWMAPGSIPAGSDYGEEIPAAIENCGAFVLALTAAAQKSRWVPKELDLAITLDKPVLPIHLDDAPLSNAFFFRLSNVQCIEAHGRFREACEDLVRKLKGIL